MAPAYWMITNRNVLTNRGGLGAGESRLSYWATRSRGSLERFSAWERCAPAVFRRELCAVADAFPPVDDPAEHEREKHVTLFIHGYNTTWQEAVRRYRQLRSALYAGRSSLGLCVLFTWPSDGLKVG